jgi:pyruvate,water dikinase
MKYICSLNALDNVDVALVGGKYASLGEMVSRLGEHCVRVPNGFAITAQAYFDFLSTKYSYGSNGTDTSFHNVVISAPRSV